MYNSSHCYYDSNSSLYEISSFWKNIPGSPLRTNEEDNEIPQRNAISELTPTIVLIPTKVASRRPKPPIEIGIVEITATDGVTKAIAKAMLKPPRAYATTIGTDKVKS